MSRRNSLSTRILSAQIAVLVVTSVIGFTLWALQIRHVLDQQYERRALAIALTVASNPQISDALAARDPQHVIAGLAARARASTGATYVVVADRSGIRYSHPNPALIGQSKEPSGRIITLDGHPHVGLDHGTLGLSANGKAPIFGVNHTVIGEVSVGVLERRVWSAVWSVLPSMAGYLGVAAVIGVAAAYLLGRRLKRQTFGLELDEIAALVQEREATLHGIREGVVALDTSGRVTLMNDQARHLLGVTEAPAGRTIGELFPDGRLRELLTAHEEPMTDQSVLVDGRILVVSRTKVVHNDADLGSVVTLRDRTELETALRELDDVRTLTDALRAQQHEFSNRMHVLSGLLELGRTAEAMTYAQQINGATAEMVADLQRDIVDPRLVALLLAKTTLAAERGVTLAVECVTPVTVDDERADALVSIVGNLVDNAMDAVTGAGGRSPAVVTVRLAEDERGLRIDVADTGPGIPAGSRDAIFADGWSTKATPGGRSRGLGLAMVRELVERLGGSVSVREGAGAQFRISIPRTRQEVGR